MEKLLCINNGNTNPYQNLATEEYLLKNYSNDIFMLWQNDESIVVGKHQNTMAEINYTFAETNKIKIARRLSGGGTVYHDSGNLNFTFIINGTEGKLVDFGKYTAHIVEFLNQLGVPAQSNARHDITVHGMKISGNAEHIHKSRVLHHGTLLFNSNLDMLDMAIKPGCGKYTDKAVQSVRSKVCNIFPYLEKSIDIFEFKELLMRYMLNKFPSSAIHQLTIDEMLKIEKLADEKYSTWDWIFGYSPNYMVTNQYVNEGFNCEIHLEIKKGLIVHVKINSNQIDNESNLKLEQILIGEKHSKPVIQEKLIENQMFEYFNLSDNFVNYLF